MNRLPILVAMFGLTGFAVAQTPPPAAQPSIELSVSAEDGPPGSGEGTANVSGKVNLPPGWKMGIHTLTIRYKKSPGNTTVNGFLPVKGAPYTFKTSLTLPAGSYQVWAVIDVKDPTGRPKEITSPPQGIPIR